MDTLKDSRNIIRKWGKYSKVVVAHAERSKIKYLFMLPIMCTLTS